MTRIATTVRRLHRPLSCAAVALGALTLSSSALASDALPGLNPQKPAASSAPAGALPPATTASPRAPGKQRARRVGRSVPTGASASTEITCNANFEAELGNGRVNFGTFIRPQAGLSSQPVAFRYYWRASTGQGGWANWDTSIRSGVYQSTTVYPPNGYAFQFYLQWAWLSNGTWQIAGAWATSYGQVTAAGGIAPNRVCRT